MTVLLPALRLADLAVFFLVPAAGAASTALGIGWRPRPGVRADRLAGLLVAAAVGWLWWAFFSEYPGGARTPLADYWRAYTDVLATTREAIAGGDRDAAGPAWWALTRASWPFWAPLGLFLRALHVVLDPPERPPATARDRRAPGRSPAPAPDRTR